MKTAKGKIKKAVRVAFGKDCRLVTVTRNRKEKSIQVKAPGVNGISIFHNDNYLKVIESYYATWKATVELRSLGVVWANPTTYGTVQFRYKQKIYSLNPLQVDAKQAIEKLKREDLIDEKIKESFPEGRFYVMKTLGNFTDPTVCVLDSRKDVDHRISSVEDINKLVLKVINGE